MPLPDPTGWVPDDYLAQAMLTSSYDPTGNNFSTYSSYDPITLPRQFWPEEDQYNRVAAHMRSMGIEPPPRGVLDPKVTAEYGRLLYESPGFLDNPANIAAIVMGGAALGGAFANGGAGYGAAAPASSSATTFPYTATGGSVTATPIAGGGVGAGTAAGAGAAGGILDSSGSVIPGTAGGVASGVTNALGNIPDWIPNYLIPGLNAALGARAADSAADAEANALQAAIEETRRQYDTTRGDLMPWITAGSSALSDLQNPDAFAASPDYGFRRSEGIRDIENTFASRGMGQSGNALRALTEFNSNLASSEYGNWFGRRLNMAGLGADTATNVGGLGADASARTGNYLAGQGVSRASGVLGKYASIGSGLNDSIYNALYRRRAA